MGMPFARGMNDSAVRHKLTQHALSLSYCELQHKCQVLLEFSIENAEMMRNCP